MFTDTWFEHVPSPLRRVVPQAVRDRHAPQLPRSQVHSVTTRSLLRSLQRREGWTEILRNNEWFQKQAVREIARYADGLNQPTLFAYSYAAKDVLRYARSRGWRTVLGQIDGGPVEEGLVEGLAGKFPQGTVGSKSAPAQYWADWREECGLADNVIVNSEWAGDCLTKAGVPREKLRIVPLAYETCKAGLPEEREYPAQFSASRPMRVLFLGQVNLRKGAAVLFEAMRRLAAAPIHFTIVGPIQIDIPPDIRSHPHAEWVGPIARSETPSQYQRADVFLFPTFSDGFGLTQLEAQFWKLPVVASTCCGSVVEHGRNGLLLSDISAPKIVEALLELQQSPAMLQRMSRNSLVGNDFGLEALSSSLMREFGGRV